MQWVFQLPQTLKLDVRLLLHWLNSFTETYSRYLTFNFSKETIEHIKYQEFLSKLSVHTLFIFLFFYSTKKTYFHCLIFKYFNQNLNTNFIINLQLHFIIKSFNYQSFLISMIDHSIFKFEIIFFFILYLIMKL